MRKVAAGVWTLFACACGGDETQIAVTVLSGPSADLATALSEITAVVEIDDGRVLVADADQKALFVADFATGQASQLGRVGSGPAEYKSIGHLVRLTYDTTLIDDYANGRFGVIVGATFAKVAIPKSGGAEFIMPRQADARGRLYSQVATMGADSVAVLRWDPRRTRLDTVAFLQDQPVAVTTSGSGSEVALSASFPKFPATDVWGILADGTVLVARARDYRVEILAFESDSAATPTRREVHPQANDSRWRMQFWMRRDPVVHAAWSRRPTTSPDGRFWVQRTSKDDAPEEYDVFDATGALVRRVVLPPTSTYAGFGPRSIYIVRNTTAGAMLSRFPLP